MPESSVPSGEVIACEMEKHRCGKTDGVNAIHLRDHKMGMKLEVFRSGTLERSELGLGLGKKRF